MPGKVHVFYLHSLGLILITLPGSLFCRQVIGGSEKLSNFLRIWNRAGPRWKPWTVWDSALFIYNVALWGLFTQQFLGNCMGNVAHGCVLEAWKNPYPVLSSCTERWKSRGHRTWLWTGEGVPLEVWSTCPHSWEGQVGAPWGAPPGKGHTCHVISG